MKDEKLKLLIDTIELQDFFGNERIIGALQFKLEDLKKLVRNENPIVQTVGFNTKEGLISNRLSSIFWRMHDLMLCLFEAMEELDEQGLKEVKENGTFQLHMIIAKRMFEKKK